MRPFIITAALALPLLFAGDPPASRKSTPPAPEAPRYSREKLDRIRETLKAQIAVRDAAENAMRQPTPAEAAALTGPATASSSPAIVAVPGGGQALRGTQAGIEFSVAHRNADGGVSITHRTTPKATGTEAANAQK